MRLFPARQKNLTEERIEQQIRVQLTKVERAKYMYMNKEDKRHWDGWKAGLMFVLKDCLGKECDDNK